MEGGGLGLNIIFINEILGEDSQQQGRGWRYEVNWEQLLGIVMNDLEESEVKLSEKLNDKISQNVNIKLVTSVLRLIQP